MAVRASASEAPLLEVVNVSVQFGARAALAGVSLQVAAGEFVGVVGPNGAGKSTLLRAVAGMVPLASGHVCLDGVPLDRRDPARGARVIAQVPQSTSIDFDFTCLEVVLMGRHPHLGRFELEGPHDHAIATQAMHDTETELLSDRSVTHVSGGEQQRVVAARALAQQPRLLVLDEPTANLDVRHRLQLLELVRRRTRDQRLAALAAIHDLELAARYCDRILLLTGGRIAADGSPADVLTPDSIAVAFGVRAHVRPEPLTGGLAITLLAPLAAEAHQL